MPSGQPCLRQQLHSLTSYDNPYVVIISLDFSKAFDTVWHSPLLDKMARLDMPDEVYDWLFSFCCDHSHCTHYRGNVSTVSEITASVIQGSSIGRASYVVASVIQGSSIGRASYVVASVIQASSIGRASYVVASVIQGSSIGRASYVVNTGDLQAVTPGNQSHREI